MSAAKGVLSLQEEDLTKILVAQAHLGAQNLDFQMEQYVFKRKNTGKLSFVLKYLRKEILIIKTFYYTKNRRVPFQHQKDVGQACLSC